jgi:hypothetical protein
VCGPDGLSGGFVIGEAVEAYVVTGARDGYQVEMWTHDGQDAYQIVPFDKLADAVRCAIDAANGDQPAAA